MNLLKAKKITVAITLFTGAVIPPLANSADTATPSFHTSTVLFTPDQEDRIGEIAKNYLLTHPNVLVDVSERLQAQQEKHQIEMLTASVLQNKGELLNDANSPSYGPQDAKVALIEFFDYQCVVCARQAPIIDAVIKANPKVRIIFKEWPIFSHRWAPSLTAAETGLKVWQQNGADAYFKYHNAIFATGHNEGKLTEEDINKSLTSIGGIKNQGTGTLDELVRTDKLAQKLSLAGTPGIIVMPVYNSTVENVTVIPGGTDQSTLQAAIDKATSVKYKN